MSEWAIQDEATGEWYSGDWWTSESKNAVRFAKYRHAMASHAFVHTSPRETARIVPAPPHEMTDAECWEWLKEHPDHSLSYWPGGQSWDCAIQGDVNQGDTPCDAIRAARRKIESGK